MLCCLRFAAVDMSPSLILRPTVSRPVCLGIKHPSGAYDQIMITVRHLRFVDVGRSLWREDGSVVYNCYWTLPAQSFSGPSPLRLAIIFYCLSFETSPFVASYDSQGHGGGIRPRLHTSLPWISLQKLNLYCVYWNPSNRNLVLPTVEILRSSVT
jgi:hypothetical protein